MNLKKKKKISIPDIFSEKVNSIKKSDNNEPKQATSSVENQKKKYTIELKKLD